MYFFRPFPIMPPWLPWIFVGGIAFMVLSFLASKYQERQHKPVAFAQDFISGAILISLLGVIIPDAFPTFPLTSSDMALPNFTNMMATAVANGDDMDIQVGPIRR
jgi:hypothetical protein